MRKLFLLSFVCLSGQGFAQKSFFGVVAGINVANQRVIYPNPNIYNFPSSGPTFFQNIIKPAAGFFYHFQLSEKMAIRANAYHMGFGYKDRNKANFTVDINYLTFPLTFHYSVSPLLSVGAGPYVSFTLNNTKLYNQNITTIYHKNDFGFIIGAEHKVYQNFSLGANYFVGTKNIWLDDQGGTIKYTNRSLQISLIYKFKKTA